MKRILTIQDVSCLGKCSITVALPIISACGVECAIMPTAILSTHTMFKNFTFRDLTGDMMKIAEHWKSEGIEFDAIYTGYLGSIDQIGIVCDIIDMFRENGAKAVVDPVMADNGNLYPGFSKEFVKRMRDLVGKSDMAVPNITEGAFLMDMPYKEKGYSESYINDMLEGLCALGCKRAVLTGVSFEKRKTGFGMMEAKDGKTFQYSHKRIDVSFHGTGDIFSSAAVGAMENGLDASQALKIACDYTVKCIEFTLENPQHESYGVEFEKALPSLIDMIREAKAKDGWQK